MFHTLFIISQQLTVQVYDCQVKKFLRIPNKKIKFLLSKHARDF